MDGRTVDEINHHVEGNGISPHYQSQSLVRWRPSSVVKAMHLRDCKLWYKTKSTDSSQ